MPWQVKIIVSRDGKPHLTAAFDHSPITLGALPTNDVVLNDPFVSGEHATVMVSRGELAYRDHSTNGSFYEGHRVEERSLGQEGRIEIPPFEIELSLEMEEAAWKTAFRVKLEDLDATELLESQPQEDPAPTPTPKPATGGRPPAPPSLPGPGSPPTPPSPGPRVLPAEGSTVRLESVTAGVDRSYLRIVEGPSGLLHQVFALPEKTARLGRAEGLEIQLLTSTVSRIHATLEPLGGGTYLLSDLDSANGCFLGEQRVKEARLRDGDEFKLGDLGLKLLCGQTVASPSTPPEFGRETISRGEALPRETTPVRTVVGLEIQTQRLKDSAAVCLVEVRGRVDSYNYTQLADALDGAIEDGGRFLVVDLSQVAFMSHTGLGVFVKSLARLQPLRGDLRLVGLSQRLLDGISLSHLDGMFKQRLAATRREALAAWRRKS